MIEFIAFIFASAFGFGLAFWIASTVLNNSNNYGDYHADAEHYSARVHFTADETLKSGDKRERYSGLSGYKKSTFSLAPKGKGLVQKATVSQVQQSGQNETPSNSPAPKPQTPADASASAPKRRDPSAFPRSFHDV